MAVITTQNIDITEFEQGSITSSGNESSTTYIRTPGYISILLPTKITIKVEATTGKAVIWDFIGYDNSNSMLCDLYWYDSEAEVDTSQYSITQTRIVLKYSDGTALMPEEISSCSISYTQEFNWVIGDKYPIQDTANELINVFSKPFPDEAFYISESENNSYPYYKSTKLLATSTEPYPAGLMVVSDGKYPSFSHLNLIRMGAFCYAVNLRKVTIPKSVKYIGRYAFRNTALTEATIASDCTYYPTSFPDNCIVKFY